MAYAIINLMIFKQKYYKIIYNYINSNKIFK